jgi:hypothetical protein
MTPLARRLGCLAASSPELRAVERMTQTELRAVIRAGLGIVAAPPLSDIERATRIAVILGNAVKRKQTMEGIAP